MVRLSGNGDKVLASPIKFVPLHLEESVGSLIYYSPEMKMELINVENSGSSKSYQAAFSLDLHRVGLKPRCGIVLVHKLLS